MEQLRVALKRESKKTIFPRLLYVWSETIVFISTSVEYDNEGDLKIVQGTILLTKEVSNFSPGETITLRGSENRNKITEFKGELLISNE